MLKFKNNYTKKIPLNEREPFVLLLWRTAIKEKGREKLNHINANTNILKIANLNKMKARLFL